MWAVGVLLGYSGARSVRHFPAAGVYWIAEERVQVMQSSSPLLQSHSCIRLEYIANDGISTSFNVTKLSSNTQSRKALGLPPVDECL